MSQDFDHFFETARREAAARFVKGDASGVVALSASHGHATFFDPGGGLVEGATAINEVNAKGAAHFGPKSTTELEVRDRASSGDLAFWTGYQHAEVDVGGTMKTMKIRVTEVFRQVEGQWTMIHRHASMAAPAGGEGAK